ncbi:MAG: hypothetical protein C4527_07790 [Candidatus Omnitrophota bacterium]|jgi:4-amino-4-deoxy-L-arabinose transferase-like glycosyltransferase|nr:MAG: hypothetical protein C4527_07790 [Candidatus Omnitrophota bacterium]
MLIRMTPKTIFSIIVMVWMGGSVDAKEYHPNVIDDYPNAHGVFLFKHAKGFFNFLIVEGVPNDVEILPNTNEIVVGTHSGEFLIMNRAGKQLFSTVLGEINDMDVLPMNDTFLLTSRSGRRVFLYNHLNNEQTNIPFAFTGPTDADWLPNDHYLVCDSLANRIVEITSDGDLVWSYEHDLAQPMDALRLENGNTLITDFDHHRILEVNPNGEVVSLKTDFDHPIKMTMTPVGDILVADGDRRRLLMLTRIGERKIIRENLNYIQTAAYSPDDGVFICAIHNKFPSAVTAPAVVSPLASQRERPAIVLRKIFASFPVNHSVLWLATAFFMWAIAWAFGWGTWISKIALTFAYSAPIGIAYHHHALAVSASPYRPGLYFWIAAGLLAVFTFRETSRSLIPKTVWRRIELLRFQFGFMQTVVLLSWSAIIVVFQYCHLVQQRVCGFPVEWYFPLIVWGIGIYFLFRPFRTDRTGAAGDRTYVQLGPITLAVPFTTGSVSDVDIEEINEEGRDRLSQSPASEYWANMSVLVVILLSICLYFIGMTSIPPDVHGDEGEVALYGIGARDSGNWNIFTPGWYDIPNLFFLIPGWGMWLFGDNLFGLRMVSSLIGVGTIPIFYLLARRLMLPVPAAIAAFLLATSTYMIHFCRMGVGYNQATFFTVIVLYFLIRGVQDGDGRSLCLAGVTSGLGFLSYQATQLLGPLCLFTLGLLFVLRGIDFRRAWQGAIVYLLSFWMSFSPIVGNHLANPETTFARVNSVSFFSEYGRTRIRYDYPHAETNLEILKNQFERSFLGTITYADRSPFFTNDKYGGMLDPIPAILFTAGCMVFLLTFKNPVAWLLLSWMVVTIFAGSVMTNSAPGYQRLTGAIPYLVLIAAPVLHGILQPLSRAFRWSPRARAAMLCSIAAVLLLTSVDRYFHKIMALPQFTDDSTRVARYIEQGGSHRYTYLFPEHFYLQYGNIRFLAPFAKGENVTKPEEFLKRKITKRGPVAFVLIRQHRKWINELRRLYPGGREETHYNRIGKDAFTTYEVNL